MKLSKAMKEVISEFEKGHLVSGRKGRTVKSLRDKGIIDNVKSHPKFDHVRGYALEFYSADVKEIDMKNGRLWDVRLRFQYPAWDEQDGIWYRGIYADSKSEANNAARQQAHNDGHLCGGKGLVHFRAFVVRAFVAE